ncbi:unnamed protein product [Anisakis simplex]|uniref:type I protein arginine methyltransferase n=1 Tax=Anisakis simplex TaxID=6269 RepID=A0A0M3JRB6_ANISI|nr:unnamed protein product [Anisakis simplex]
MKIVRMYGCGRLLKVSSDEQNSGDSNDNNNLKLGKFQIDSNVKIGICVDDTNSNYNLLLLSENDRTLLKKFIINTLLSIIVINKRIIAIDVRHDGQLIKCEREPSVLVYFDDVKGIVHVAEMSQLLHDVNLRMASQKPNSNDERSAFISCNNNSNINNNNNNDHDMSVFDARTEHASASQYFQFYGYLSQQQNMMQDYIRTSTYQRAIHVNSNDFKDKVVMDVGAGSGILSFFAVQAGARKVYAVEASSVAIQCAELVRSNNLTDKIVVVPGRVEEIMIPEKVDIIISEPMGYMLVNERMLESYIHSRKFLKNGGRMFPTLGELHVALFSDEALFIEQSTKANFWCQENFHGINLTGLRAQALVEIFKQPIVDTWHVNTLMSGSTKWSVNFETDDENELHNIHIPFELSANKNGFVHGLAFWFDVAFIGGVATIWLSTAPTEPLTHWYQVRCLFDKPVMVFVGQTVKGTVNMIANERQSYDVEVSAEIGDVRVSNTVDLKNPLFRYNGSAVLIPAGFSNESPSDAILQHASSILFFFSIFRYSININVYYFNI